MSGRRSLLLAVIVLVAVTDLSAEWWLWQSPTNGNEPLDQEQTNLDSGYDMFPVYPPQVPVVKYGVGQIFVPLQSPLYRIDLKMHNRYDDRPVRFRLWQWNGSYAATTQAAPLFADTISIPGPDQMITVSIFPRDGGGAPLTVTTGVHYYFELDNTTADHDFAIAGSPTNMVPPTPDRYVCPPPAASICDVRVNNAFQPPGDLYFKTYSSPVGASPAAPCCTFSATTPWTAPSLTQNQRTYASDYAWFLEQWVLNQPPNYLQVIDGNCSQNALFEAFLYRKNGSTASAANAVRLLENAWQCRFGTPGSPCDLDRLSSIWMERPGYAFLWIQNVSSAIFPPSSRAHAKELLIDSARRLWPVRERGVFNRALFDALSYKLISEIVVRGVDVSTQEYDKWLAYADGVWSEFNSTWDTEEDSIGYNGLSWHAILELAMEYGNDATIWAQPGFRALVERSYKQSTPLGLHPTYGDNYGMNVRWPSMAWLFHKAAAKWNDPQYKWLGDRVFDYHRTHIKDTANNQPLPLWAAVYVDEYPVFAHGYFDIASAPDWTSPPVGVLEVNAAKQDQEMSTSWLGQAIGQTFKPTDSVLASIALKLKNRGSTASGTIQLWKWLGSYAATVAASNPVLYRDSVPFACTAQPSGYCDIAFEPYLVLDTNATYFFEVNRSPKFEMGGSSDGSSPYPDGALVVGGASKTADAFFVTKTLSKSGSTVTYRRQATRRRFGQFSESTDVDSAIYPNRFYDFTSASIPDKLVLRSGYDRDDLTFVANLVAGFYGHAHQETGGIVLATDKSAVLMAGGSAYSDHLFQDQTVPVAKRYWEGAWEALPDKTVLGDPAQPSLRGFNDYRKASVAVVHWDDSFGWNMQQERRFLFVKNRFLVVRDKTLFESAMRATTGPIWHARDMTGDLSFSQRNWFDVFDREPQGLNGWRFYNPQRYMFLYMSPRAGREYSQELRAYDAGNPPTPPYVAYQRWNGSAVANQSVWSDSVLIPHGLPFSVQDAAAAITPFVLSGPGAADAYAVRINLSGETWYVIDNPTGASIGATTPVSLATDARYAIVRQKTGVPQHYVLTYDASVFNLGSIVQKNWGVRTSVELNGNVP